MGGSWHRRKLSASTIGELEPFMRQVSVAAGARLFSAGDGGDQIYFIRHGRLNILLPLEGGKQHHLATFCRGEFFGEISFLDQGLRSANAEAATASELFALSRQAFDTLADKNQELAAYVFEKLALAIAQRLRVTDSEVSALEER